MAFESPVFSDTDALVERERERDLAELGGALDDAEMTADTLAAVGRAGSQADELDELMAGWLCECWNGVCRCCWCGSGAPD